MAVALCVVPAAVCVALVKAAAQPCVVSAIHSTAPVVFEDAQAVYDTIQSRILVIDFSPTRPARIYAWWGAPASWQLVSDNGPAWLTGSAAAFDQARHTVVVHGGAVSGSAVNTTWEWNGTEWFTIPASPAVPARSRHAMTYDVARQRTILFGGIVGGVATNDAWEWGGATWIELPAGVLPLPRISSSLVYDSDRQRIILIGGMTLQGTPLTDLWEYSGSAWTARNYFGPWQSPRSVVYDPGAARVFALVAEPSREVAYWWDVNANTWDVGHEVPPGTGAARAGVFDPVLHRMVFCAGSGLNLWNGTASAIAPWTVTPPMSIVAQSGLAAEFRVVAGGDPEYQWLRDGQPLEDGGAFSGTQTPRLLISHASNSHEGVYSVRLSNACDTVESPGATLTVVIPCYSGLCYANCDISTSCPALTANDFVCFFGRYVAGESYADCDGGGTLNANDFACFLNAFAAGCS